ncbi:MAG: hypothetical protein SF029_11990 [bacterium]|nr:hypothetical protein [bacterium]
MNALHERMQAKGSSSRPELHGWIEKNGHFSLAVTSSVFGRLHRTTRMSGAALRENGSTVIRGYVSDGVSPQWQKILAGVLVVVCVVLLFSGQAVLGLSALLVGGAAYVPMRGDYNNSEILLMELERTLKASPKPSKKPGTTSAPRPAKPAVVRPAVAKAGAGKPAAKGVSNKSVAARPAVAKPAAAGAKKK